MAAKMDFETREFIEFRITGFPDSSFELVKALKIERRHTWKAGEIRVPNTPLKHTVNGIKFIAKDDETDFEERVMGLLRRVSRLRNKLLKLRGQCQLFCAVYFSGSNRPVVSFPKSALAQLAQMNASIDVDLYYLGDSKAA